MFNKLRNRFLIVNMVIISLIMLVAFTAIYTITYRNVSRDIDMDLRRVSEFFHKPGGKFGDHGPGFGPVDNLSPMDPMKGGSPPEDRSVSFAVQTDDDWNVVSVNTRFDMELDFYKQAVGKVAAGSAESGKTNLDDNKWAYLVQRNETGYFVLFLDVTAQQTILTNLVYTFLAVGLAMLVIIFFTSRYFANRSIAPVQEAFNRQKQFIADASHELRTPLAVINTNADVLLSNSDDTIASQAKWLHHIKSETDRMKTLTSDLLYLTEMDDERANMIYADVNVSEAVESVILTMEAVVYERDLTLGYEIDPGLNARGNAEQLKQVVMILLDNAVKYTNPKGSIELALKRRHNDIVLSVTNTGEGIPAEHLGRIFDRFYRADSSRSRKQGGYGLGLAIAKSIVEQHKGKLSAKSTVGETTSFYVQLPSA
ncbi:sensor histidine kinase [Cohnella sp. GCM10027633]|uniref:sensor histidine kinase n=1 Tax=unclassified Cohnella TaxID=2636738 RepID=UPI00363BAE0D